MSTPEQDLEDTTNPSSNPPDVGPEDAPRHVNRELEVHDKHPPQSRWWILPLALVSVMVLIGVGIGVVGSRLVDQSCPYCTGCFSIFRDAELRGQGEYDNFGQNVAVSANGNRVVGMGNAFLRVYDMMEENKWTQVITDLDLGAEYDFFSGSIAISSDGTRLAVGAILYNEVENTTQVSFVRVFDLTENRWAQVGLDLEGGSVALSSDGNRIAIGGQQRDDLGDILVRIFDWTGSQWTQVGSNLYDNLAEGYSTFRFATLGGSVALSSDGNRVAVGSFQTPFGEQGTSLRGQVRVYDWTGSQWTQVGGDLGTDLPDVGTNPWEVDLSSDGNRIIMTAPGKADSLQVSYLSTVLIYACAVMTQEWTLVDHLNLEYMYQIETVTSVAISSNGKRASVGVAMGVGYSNSVFNFAWTGSQWTLLRPELLGGEKFGPSVALALDGDRAVVGSPWDSNPNPNTGSIQIYNYDHGCIAGNVPVS